MAEKKENQLKAPPQSLDAERALLGAILIRPDAMNDVVEIVTDDSFYSHKHKIIWRALSELASKNDPIDALSVSNILSNKGELESAGGSTYLGELVASVPSTSNARHYAEIVHKKNIMRRLIETGERIKDAGYDEETPIDDVLDQANKLVHEVSNMTPQNKVILLKDVLDDAWTRFDRLHKSGTDFRGVPTGFKDLDNLLSGLQKSDLIILAARPSMGKTSLALDIARNVAVHSKTPVCLFSLEMSNEQLVDRMLAAEARVNSFKLRTGKLTLEEDFGRIRDALSSLSEAPIYVDDQGANNIVKMRAVARKLEREGKLGLIIVDYLQLMVPTNVKNDNLVQQVTEISRSLKQLAKEFNVPVLALSQLSRAVEARGGKPRLSDLRDSGSIEQDADVVMFIHREDKYNEESERKNIADILIEKHRNGPTGILQLFFDQDKSTFISMEKNDFGDFGKSA